MSVSSLNWVDWALVATLLSSVALGFARGLVFEVMSLVGWVVAWFVAQWFAPEVALHLPVGVPGSSINAAAAFALTFVAALVVWGLLARLVRLLVHATPLSVIDRLMGGAFGILRGILLLLVVAMVVALSPAGKSLAWRESRGAMWLNSSLQGIKPVLPASVVKLLPAN
jgi:membrane protein required for colicin V production